MSVSQANIGSKAGWMPAEPGRVIHVPTAKIYASDPLDPFDLLAVVEHIAEGGENTWKWLFHPAGVDGGGPVSSHFFVTDKGVIYQGASIYDRTWANGLTYVSGDVYRDPQKVLVVPTWYRLVGASPYRGQDPNKLTVSIEHQGYYIEQRTVAEIDANVRILKFIASQTGLTWVEGDTLIRHANISPKNRANCPGPNFNLATLAALANASSDPLRARKLPGAGGSWYYCGTGFYDYYMQWGQLHDMGYATSDEYPDTDQLGRKVTRMRFERCWLGYVEGEGVRPTLLNEIIYKLGYR